MSVPATNRSASHSAARPAEAFLRCDGCGLFTRFNPRDVGGSLGGDVPLCPDCRLAQAGRVAQQAP